MQGELEIKNVLSNLKDEDLVNMLGYYNAADTFVCIINLEILSGFFDERSLLVLDVVDQLLECIEKKFKNSIAKKLALNKILLLINQSGAVPLKEDLLCFVKEFERSIIASSDKMFSAKLSIGISEKREEKDLFRSFESAYIALSFCMNEGLGPIAAYDEVIYKIKRHHADLEMASYFLDALKQHRLKLAFQPVINASNGKTKSYEALLRILTKEGNLISCGPFVQVAEKFRFIDEIDAYVLDLAVAELIESEHIILAINVSTMSMLDDGWIKKIKKIAEKSPSITERLIIEITETGLNQELETIARFVDIVKSLGCQVAIDDFGSGYTSFKQLKMLNADILKIDGAFVRDIVENPDSQLFVQTLLEFSNAYGLKTVAEFVETGEIARILMNLGVDYMQGYYFGEPVIYRPWIGGKAMKLEQE